MTPAGTEPGSVVVPIRVRLPTLRARRHDRNRRSCGIKDKVPTCLADFSRTAVAHTDESRERTFGEPTNREGWQQPLHRFVGTREGQTGAGDGDGRPPGAVSYREGRSSQTGGENVVGRGRRNRSALEVNDVSCRQTVARGGEHGARRSDCLNGNELHRWATHQHLRAVSVEICFTSATGERDAESGGRKVGRNDVAGGGRRQGCPGNCRQ